MSAPGAAPYICGPIFGRQAGEMAFADEQEFLKVHFISAGAVMPAVSPYICEAIRVLLRYLDVARMLAHPVLPQRAHAPCMGLSLNEWR